MERWVQHIEELLKRPTPERPPEKQSADTDFPIYCNKPSKTEIRRAITALKNRKAEGRDEIPAEAINADKDTAVNILNILQNHFKQIWEEENIPEEWKESIHIKLPPPKKKISGTVIIIGELWSSAWQGPQQDLFREDERGNFKLAQSFRTSSLVLEATYHMLIR